jgi:hypothetical protein
MGKNIDRECENCKHYVNNRSCEVWDCEYEPITGKAKDKSCEGCPAYVDGECMANDGEDIFVDDDITERLLSEIEAYNDGYKDGKRKSKREAKRWKKRYKALRDEMASLCDRLDDETTWWSRARLVSHIRTAIEATGNTNIEK